MSSRSQVELGNLYDAWDRPEQAVAFYRLTLGDSDHV